MTPSIGVVGEVLSWFSGDSEDAEVAALQQSASNFALQKQKELGSSITLNQNITTMVEEWAFSEGKLAAIEAIDQGKTEAEVKDEAKQRANQEIAIIQENILNAGNSAHDTIYNLMQQTKEAENVAVEDVFTMPDGDNVTDLLEYRTEDIELVDGRLVEQNILVVEESSNYDRVNFAVFDAGNEPGAVYNQHGTITPQAIATDGTQYWFQPHADNGEPTLNDAWNEVQSAQNTVTNNLETWVGTVIKEVQAGNLDPGELTTPADMVRTITSDEPRARAIADLRALNVAAEWEHPATVELQSDPITLYGATVGVSDPAAKSSINQGETIDPSSFTDTNFYVNYDVVASEADWRDNYDSEKEIDGGILHLTALPGPDVQKWLGKNLQVKVLTSYDETATFLPSDTTKKTVDGQEVWEIDIGGQLENGIAEVVDMKVYVNSQQDTMYLNRIPNQPFTIRDIEGSTTLRMERERELQTDDNYITDDEWDQVKQQQEDTLDEIQESTGVGGGGFFEGGFPSLPGLGVIESAVVVILAIVGLNAASGCHHDRTLPDQTRGNVGVCGACACAAVRLRRAGRRQYRRGRPGAARRPHRAERLNAHPRRRTHPRGGDRGSTR
jgi:hypothetical protein